MARRLTPAQFKSKISNAKRELRQAADKHDREVRRYNAEVKRAVDDYNRDVRAYESRVRSNRRRLETEAARLRRQQSTTRYVVNQTSSWRLHEVFARVEEAADAGAWTQQRALLADLAEGEAANSARAVNTLLSDADEVGDARDIAETSLSDELSSISMDLDQRWKGALFALSPHNPDAARHFCTSSREVLVKMLDIEAADRDVLAMPNCQTTQDGKPTRRAKIMYLLARGCANEESLSNFVEQDINDVMELFGVVNSGTHGAAGKFNFGQLTALKERVEGAIHFLGTVIRGV